MKKIEIDVNDLVYHDTGSGGTGYLTLTYKGVRVGEFEIWAGNEAFPITLYGKWKKYEKYIETEPDEYEDAKVTLVAIVLYTLGYGDYFDEFWDEASDIAFEVKVVREKNDYWYKGK